MKNKRRLRKSKLLEIIENHININIKGYAISVLVFLIGVIVGIILLNSSNNEVQEDISGYINEFVNTIKSNEYEIDTNKLLIKAIISNLKIAVLMWIAGLTLIGIPLIYAILGYKGICVGYSISAIIASLGKLHGILIATSSMLLQNLVAIPCILALAVSSIKMHKIIMKNHNKDDLKFEIYRHTIFSIIMSIGLIISAFAEIYLSTNLVSYIIKNFI